MKATVSLSLLLSVALGGCSVKYTQVGLLEETLYLKRSDPKIEKKILSLYKVLHSLSSKVDEEEAKVFSRTAVLYSSYLAEEYELVSPPNMHNFLITIGFRERGLCYHWTNDLIAYLSKHKLKSFDLYRAVYEQGKLNEHNSIVVTATGQPFSEGIILDAWRNSSDLYFKKLSEDRDYIWKQNQKYKVIKGISYIR